MKKKNYTYRCTNLYLTINWEVLHDFYGTLNALRSTYMHGMLKRTTIQYFYYDRTHFAKKQKKKCLNNIRLDLQKNGMLSFGRKIHRIYILSFVVHFCKIPLSIHLECLFKVLLNAHNIISNYAQNDNRESSFNHIGGDFIYFSEIFSKIFFPFSFYIIHILSQMHSNSTDSQ